MANGDITKETEYDKIEIVNTWTIQVRQVTKIMEEQLDGSKKELTRTFHRHVLVPFSSNYKSKTNDAGNSVPDLDKDGKMQWTHTATDISGEDASVQAIANAAWTDSVKIAFKTSRENQDI